jgi:hypothetical protein
MNHKILVSHEAPISILEQVSTHIDYEYCLVHLYDSIPAYANFYKKSKLNNREVLLDNSIFELGKAFEANKFAKVIDELLPNYYIIPDVLENGYATCESFHNFTKEYKDLPGLKIGAVQGKCYEEIVDCYKYMSDNADYIAISFDFSYYINTGRGNTKLERWCDGRKRLINNLIADGAWNWNKPHHLLGCSLAKEFRYYIDNNIYNIRSVDTSNPVVAGIKDMKYNGDLGLQDKPSVKLADLIDHEVTEDAKEAIFYNIAQFKKILKR